MKDTTLVRECMHLFCRDCIEIFAIILGEICPYCYANIENNITSYNLEDSSAPTFLYDRQIDEIIQAIFPHTVSCTSFSKRKELVDNTLSFSSQCPLNSTINKPGFFSFCQFTKKKFRLIKFDIYYFTKSIINKIHEESFSDSCNDIFEKPSYFLKRSDGIFLKFIDKRMTKQLAVSHSIKKNSIIRSTLLTQFYLNGKSFLQNLTLKSFDIDNKIISSAILEHFFTLKEIKAEYMYKAAILGRIQLSFFNRLILKNHILGIRSYLLKTNNCLKHLHYITYKLEFIFNFTICYMERLSTKKRFQTLFKSLMFEKSDLCSTEVFCNMSYILKHQTFPTLHVINSTSILNDFLENQTRVIGELETINIALTVKSTLIKRQRIQKRLQKLATYSTSEKSYIFCI